MGAWLILLLGPALNALTLGEDTAQTMGINLVKTRYALVIGVAMIGATTAVAGAVGWISSSHILRRLGEITTISFNPGHQC